MKVENKGSRTIAVLTAAGIQTVAPGKSADFKEEPLNLEALQKAKGVNVSGEAKKEAAEPVQEPPKEPAKDEGTGEPVTPTPAPAPQAPAASKPATAAPSAPAAPKK